MWGLVTDKPLLVLLSTELLKGEPSVFGLLGHNQNTRGTKIQGWRMVWETSYFLYNTHTHTHTLGGYSRQVLCHNINVLLK